MKMILKNETRKREKNGRKYGNRDYKELPNHQPFV